MKTLDSRIPRGGPVVWKTVVKDGKKFTLQVWVCPGELENLIAEKIDQVDVSHTFDAGPFLVQLTRQL